MPSIKSCLASVLAVSLAFAPVASARNSLHDGTLLAARAHPFSNVERAVVSPANDLESRSTSAKKVALQRAAAARAYKIKAAKARAKKAKAKAQQQQAAAPAAAAAAAPVVAAPVIAVAQAKANSNSNGGRRTQHVPGSTPTVKSGGRRTQVAPARSGPTGSASSGSGTSPATGGGIQTGGSKGGSTGGSKGGVTVSSYNPGSAFMTSALVAAFGEYQCVVNANCNAVPGIPANASPYCLPNPAYAFPLYQCTYRCNEGYMPMTDGTCAPEPNACSGVTCADVINGFNTCSNGVCTPNCNEGDTYFASDNACRTLTNDVDNCGAAGNACPESYNGVGSPNCQNGKCGLSCPVGTAPRKVMSTSEPLGCF